MRVGIIQPNYIPWRGYFDFIASVDLFVFHDDVQYTKQDWRNRNMVKLPEGLRWLTVPVERHAVKTPICDIEIAGKEWIAEHRKALTRSFWGAPFARDAIDLWEQVQGHTSLSEMNQSLTKSICAYLGIGTEFISSKKLGVSGMKTDRLIQILSKVGATTYLSGPNAKNYLDESAMNDAGIALEYMTYNVAPYPQQWGEFIPAVTVLDSIANVGRAQMRKAA